MTQKYWYYVINNQQEGPIIESELLEMFIKGHLGPETLVWSDSLTNWTPASEIESFRDNFIHSPPSLPGVSPPVTSSEQLDESHQKSVSQIRPWVRYAARYIDNLLFAVIIVFIFEFAGPSIMEMNDVLFEMIIVFLWIFVEAPLLSSWGTTPGKWLLRITLRDSAGRKLTFSKALNRSFSVWGRGLGLGFPLATIVTLIISYKKLTRNGITSWDDRGKFVITHEKIGILRAVITILVLIGFIALIVSG